MESRYNEAYSAVISFVEELWDVFGEKTEISPLALYNRLLNHIKLGDKESINRCLTGFRYFVATYNDNLINDDMDNIPKNAKITYGTSDKIYIEMGKFIKNSDSDTCDVIRQHLLTISAILESDGEKAKILEDTLHKLNIDTNTNEGKFVSDIMGKAHSAMANMDDVQDPTAAIASLMQSGLLSDLTTGIQQGVENGNMDVGRLLSSMQGAINNLIPLAQSQSSFSPEAQPISSKTKITEVHDDEIKDS